MTSSIEGCLAWIETQSEADRERRRRDFIATLQRATLAEHGANASAQAAARLDYVILRHMPALAADLVAVMAQTPGQLQSRVEAALDALDFEARRALELALPAGRLQLLNAGRREEALAANQEAADMGRGFAEAPRMPSCPVRKRA